MRHRYLTQMCDQVVSLISSELAQTIVWSEEDDADANDGIINKGELERMFTFEVAQTTEQEESVTVREGFKVNMSCTLVSSRLTKYV